MIAKPLSEVVEADLQGLIDAGAQEGPTLEFKRELPEPGDQGGVRFLKSVTAFANTQGGDLIFGIEEKNGVAAALVPLTVPGFDQVFQRFDNLRTNGVDPRLADVHYHRVPLKQGGDALLVRIQRSWNAPHRVTTGGHAQFYARSASGAYPMNVTDLRRAFSLHTEVIQRIKEFRSDRIYALASGQAPVILQHGAIMVLHVVPLQAWVYTPQINLPDRHFVTSRLRPLNDVSCGSRPNLEGRLIEGYRDKKGLSGYNQIYRNGTVEAVLVYPPQGSEPDDRFLSSVGFERTTLAGLKSYLPALRDLGFEPPAYIFLSFLGIKGYELSLRSGSVVPDSACPADRDFLDIPEVTLCDWTCDVATLMRPAFDSVWNVFGYEGSANYNKEGKWSQDGK